MKSEAPNVFTDPGQGGGSRKHELTDTDSVAADLTGRARWLLLNSGVGGRGAGSEPGDPQLGKSRVGGAAPFLPPPCAHTLHLPGPGGLRGRGYRVSGSENRS